MLFHRPEELKVEERGIVEHLFRQCPDVQVAHALAQEFIGMVREHGERQVAPFEQWLVRAKTSGVQEVRNFAFGLQRDKRAVSAALCLEYSNGQTEGQVGRLKFIKRAGYGRAKLDLLRQRVLVT
jgi:transposase